MPSSSELLSSYSRLLQRLSGAGSVSLYLPPAPEIAERPWLVHANGHPALPELADAGAARGLAGAGVALEPVASREPGGCLIPVPAGPGEGAQEDDGDRRHNGPANGRPALWIGLRLEPGAALPAGDAWRRALAHGAAVAGLCRRVDAVLRDPVTELPGRADFQAALRREAGLAVERRRPLALILTNPDDFSLVNERFGSEAGDAVVRGIAGRLQGTLRRSDLVHRYGGVVFAVILPGVARAEAVAVAEKLHAALSEGAYLDGALRLGFSFGLATLDGADPREPPAGGHPDEAAWELIRQADRALNKAKISTSGRVVAWRPGTGDEVVVHRDRLAGIFTADLAKDYRNMLLLWDTVDIMTARADPGELAAKAVERLAATFKPDRAGLFRWTAAGPELAAGAGGRGGGEPAFGAAERVLLERARAERDLVEARLPAAGGADAAYALPLLARGEPLGCLYLAGRAEGLALDASDLIFLKALAGQLAAALDRAELAARERRAKERESRRLKSELEELRHAAREAELVYRSPQMEALLANVRRAAPTDATVLVTGPSGAGKELVARMVHTLSPRRGEPPVVVDCAAISATLIESELFGHEEGAYTGAAGRTLGRLAEAAGSTLILDEIGELPLEVQAKLLRFVQQKQIVPVGGVRPRKIDARLVAVTNRDLAAEVAAGRFREDLYYRLKVFHLEVPTLAEHPDDIPLLADHFVARFAERYHKPVRGLSAEALELARRYRWPGNVRELENRLLQAVVLAEGEEIGPKELGITAEETSPAAERAAAARRRRARKGREAGVDTTELKPKELEKRHLERLLRSVDGSVEQAAEKLGVARSTFYQKMKRLGVAAPRRPRRR